MGNCLALAVVRRSSKKTKSLPIDTTFNLPSPLPTWPTGEKGGFASGSIDLGGLHVCPISSLKAVWASRDGGPDNVGATFFEPSSLPEGFSMLGCYSQSNNRPLYGWVLAAKDDPGAALLQKPVDYTLVWSSQGLNIKKNGDAYIWLPTAPDGYKAVGHVITNSPEKPSLEKVRCVRSDFTDQCEVDTWIWGPGKNPGGFGVFQLRPSNRGTQAMGVGVGAFGALTNGGNTGFPVPLGCLKNVKSNKGSMPDLRQIEALAQAYSPTIYFHPDEQYLPSSVSWFFTNGALLYKRTQESQPVAVDATGSNLPQGGSNDGAYWLDLPADEKGKERVKKGDLSNSEAYLHVKQMLGGTFTDIAVWVFCPFNGASRAKVEFVTVPLGRIGEHVGDWEHVTLRVSNFNGQLESVYFSEHSGGMWVSASQLEFESGSNRVVAYASLHGHAMYYKPGLVLQGSKDIGIRNDAAKSKMFLNTASRFLIVAAEYLESSVVEPPWVNYYRKWGPNISYDIQDEFRKVEKLLPGMLKSAFKRFVNSLPNEVLGEDGPTGPKAKTNWVGDEA